MPELEDTLNENEVGDVYEDVVGYSTLDDGLLVSVTDCEMELVGWVPKDRVAAITKVLNWVPEKLRGTEAIGPLDPEVTTALIANTYEANVSVESYDTFDDVLIQYGDPPKGCVPILDAELALVMYAPKEKADMLARIFNWADRNVPTPYDLDENAP